MNRPSLAALAGSVTAACAMIVACTTSDPAPPPATQATMQGHIDAATAAAGSDLKQFLGLCNPVPATRPKGDDSQLAALIAKPAPPPGKAFDNLYYLGDSWVSAWAINTPDGIILLDTLNNGKEAARLIEGGLRRLGLNPANIKYIIVTHGHGDHYGGVTYLAGRYHPIVVMGEPDWTMTSTKLDFESTEWDVPPRFDAKHDVAAKDNQTVTLGDTLVTLYLTPGHTPGTISPVFDVTWHGEKHRAIEWGGTGFNFGKDFAKFDDFVASTQRMRELVKQQNIDVLLSNHPNFDLAHARLEEIRKNPRGPNPFVIGEPAVERALTVMNECARAQIDRFKITP